MAEREREKEMLGVWFLQPQMFKNHKLKTCMVWYGLDRDYPTSSRGLD